VSIGFGDRTSNPYVLGTAANEKAKLNLQVRRTFLP